MKHALSSVISVAVAAVVSIGGAPGAQTAQSSGKINVAHRGASAYAPEHTAPAYHLAIEQGADYIEQDLGVTKDGVLVSIHDATLERTTNVEDLFPDRFTLDTKGQKRWIVADFTLAEIRRLDAGSWFGARFAGEKILTWDESVDVIDRRAGLYPEMKTPDLYRERGINIVQVFAEAIRARGLDVKTPFAAVRPLCFSRSTNRPCARRPGCCPTCRARC
jgi:glycerophosphoryl diester phosphodiesterase